MTPDVVDAPIIANLPFHDRFVVGGAVLRDVDRGVAVAGADPLEHPPEAVGIHLPADVGEGDRPIVRPGQTESQERQPQAPHDEARVVVHPHEVRRRPDHVPVRIPNRPVEEAHDAGERPRVAAKVERVHEQSVEALVQPTGEPLVYAPFGVDGRKHVGYADSGVRAERLDGPVTERVGEHEHVGSLRSPHRRVAPRRVHAAQVPRAHHRRRLVERHPARHAVAQASGNGGSVVREPFRRITIGPPSPPLQRQGQVPMVERDKGLHAGLKEGVHQPVIESQPLLVHAPGTGGEDARPGDGKPVGAHSQLSYEIQVLTPAVVVIARNVAGITAGDVPGPVREPVPDALALAVLVPRPFNLVGGSACAPEKAGREREAVAIGGAGGTCSVVGGAWFDAPCYTKISGFNT